MAAVDEVERRTGTTTDGCSPFSNAGAVAGKIALIERGLCGFAVKARNATNAGAAAVIIYNNAANVNGAPPGMADDGINGAFVLIPTVSLRRADGLAILGQLGAAYRWTSAWISPFAPVPMRRIAPGSTRRFRSSVDRRSRTTTPWRRATC